MTENRKLHLYTYLLAIYYLLAPLEDFLTGSVGTLAKYLCILIAAAALIESHGKIVYKATTFNRCLLIMMLISVVSILWSVDRQVTAGRLVAYLLVPGITLFVGLLDFEEKDYDTIVNAAIAGGVITALFLLTTGRFNLSGYYRLTLTENNDPNNFAALLMLPLALCFRKTEQEKKIISILKKLIAAIILVIILYTGSRGAIGSIAVMAFVFFMMNKSNEKLRFLILGGIAAVFISLFVIPHFSAALLRHFSIGAVLNDMTMSEGQRGNIWRHVLFDVIPNMYPWGYGAGCQGISLYEFYGYNKGVHNTYLSVIVEYGVFGIPFFLGMLISLYKKEYKSKHYLETALLVGICGIIFFLDAYAKKFFWNVIMLILIREAAIRNNTMERS